MCKTTNGRTNHPCPSFPTGTQRRGATRQRSLHPKPSGLPAVRRAPGQEWREDNTLSAKARKLAMTRGFGDFPRSVARSEIEFSAQVCEPGILVSRPYYHGPCNCTARNGGNNSLGVLLCARPRTPTGRRQGRARETNKQQHRIRGYQWPQTGYVTMQRCNTASPTQPDAPQAQAMATHT